MFSDFAFSSQMQLLLVVVSFATTFFSLYLIAELILTFCGVKASMAQKAIFAFITGTLLHNLWVYGIYFLGGMVSFPPIMHALIVNPNPLMALLYYYAATKIFWLPPVRSIKTMGYVYLYWTLNTTVYQLLGNTIFAQTGPSYNYLLDAMAAFSLFLLFFLATKLLLYYIQKNHTKLEFVDSGFLYRKREFLFFFARTSLVYIVHVFAPLAFSIPAVSSIFISMFMLMFLFFNLLLDLHRYDKQVIRSQEVHISALFKGLEEFRGIKHDFYNILHTYSGYLELEEYDRLKTYHASLVETTSRAGTTLELARRMAENPALVTLLLDKLALAEKSSVKFLISIKCSLEDFYIDMVDFCRALACLIDNAIEAATESNEKRIYFTCETKDADSKLVIITNATSAPVDLDSVQIYGMTSKQGHSGIGLNIVRNTLGNYGNCTFRIQYFNQEFSAYLDLQRI